MKRIVILGSTGSIGTQTLDVIRALPDQFTIVGLAAGSNTDLLAEQIAEFKPRMVHNAAGRRGSDDGAWTEPEAMVTEPDVDLVMMGTTGRVSLAPTLAALEAGKAVALSNKEVIVMAGGLVREAARRGGGAVLPVDSEPSAIWQCMRGEDQPVRRLIITASGGPFRSLTNAEKAEVTPQEALAHPTWVMGRKITIDSATLMNKGFEVIESRWLFDVTFDQIEVVVHPQSIIHSMVEFADGSVKAQMGPPDMRLPIQHAMTYPERVASSAIPTYDPLRHPSLTFEPLDTERNPCFAIALEAGRKGGTYPAVLSAADEEAVHLFLDGRIRFGDIPALVRDVLAGHDSEAEVSVDSLLSADEWARRRVAEVVAAVR